MAEEIAAAPCRKRWVAVGPPGSARYRLRGTIQADPNGRLRAMVMLLVIVSDTEITADACLMTLRSREMASPWRPAEPKRSSAAQGSLKSATSARPVASETSRPINRLVQGKPVAKTASKPISLNALIAARLAGGLHNA